MNNTDNAEKIESVPVLRCLLCGSEGHLKYKNLDDRLFGYSKEWNIRECINPECGLLWLDPMPLESEIWKAYTKYYTHTDQNKGAFSFLKHLETAYIKLKYLDEKPAPGIKRYAGYLMYLLPTEKAETDFKMMYLKKMPGGKLLDVGCGNGWFITNMKQFGWEVYGTDLDAKAVEYCKTQGLNAFEGSLETINFPEDYFDAIVVNHAIEHVYRAQSLLNECFRILKKGGTLRVATPNSKSYLHMKKFKKAWFPLDPPRHLYLYNPKLLESMASRAGFKHIRAITSPRNDFWVYVGSKYIKLTGSFKLGEAKHTKFDILIGKLYQFLVWLKLRQDKEAGGEIHLMAEK